MARVIQLQKHLPIPSGYAQSRRWHEFGVPMVIGPRCVLTLTAERRDDKLRVVAEVSAPDVLQQYRMRPQGWLDVIVQAGLFGQILAIEFSELGAPARALMEWAGGKRRADFAG